jgi:hypothetical protein
MTNTTPNDAVNHPSHYTQYPVEVIELTRHMTFNRGNAVKYVARAGYKGGPEKELEDIDKAIWYLIDERKLVEGKLAQTKLEEEAAEVPWTKGLWQQSHGTFLTVDGSIASSNLDGAKG